MAAMRQKEPKTPFPRQTQSKPGLDSEMDPKPRFQAPLYRGAGKLAGKAALVTGGDSGIGKAVATLYAREGADVAIVYLPEEQSDADETKKSVESEGRRCLQIPGDVKDPGFCQAAIDKTAKALGKIDVLVNNAAFQERQDRPEDISDEQFDVTFDVALGISALLVLVSGALLLAVKVVPAWTRSVSIFSTPSARSASS